VKISVECSDVDRKEIFDEALIAHLSWILIPEQEASGCMTVKLKYLSTY